jgi:hypothetical protein
MYAVEFRTKIKDGVIELPKRFKGTITDTVKVIILKEDPSALPISSGADIIDRLLASPLQIQGFQPLTRDEIHDR